MQADPRATEAGALRVGFAGTPPFAARVLTAIRDAGFAVPLVLTQPDRPAGRGLRLLPSAVKAMAEANALPLMQPATLKSGPDVAAVTQVPLGVLVVAAYGLILPPAVLAWPRHGCLNVHASLLPRWRGAAPIERSLLAGDAETGVTIMQMDAGLDTGAMVDTVHVAVAPRETAGTLHDKLAAAGAKAIVDVLVRLARDGRLATKPQPAAGATYAAKVVRADAAIDWTGSAAGIERQVRAFNPVPGAYAMHAGNAVKIWSAVPMDGVAAGTPPGTIVRADAEGVVTACGDGALRLTELQPAGGRRMTAADFVAGRRLVPGMRFDPLAA